MCLATPMKVIKINGNWAEVEGEGHTHRVNLSLLKNVKVGDYVLAHTDMAINKLPKEEAEKILEIIASSNHNQCQL